MTTVDSAGVLLGGRYRLAALAGSGGMAEVWRAEVLGAHGFKRSVAIKRVLPELLDNEQFRQMFIEEARVTAALDHANIVRVYDFGEDSSGLYLALEWVDGLTLREVTELYHQRGMHGSPVLMAGIVIEVLRALEASHAHSAETLGGSRLSTPIVHRDVTPSNVMLSTRGAVKLADFGLARAFDRARLTPADMLKGKLAYLAPEQLRGHPAEIRTDLYSCGVMLWELICGRRMFIGKSDADIVRALLARVPHPTVRSVRPEVPAALAETADRAVNMEPGERFQTATAFARALCDVLRTMPERTDTTRIAEMTAHALTLRIADPEIPVEYEDAIADPATTENSGLSAATREPVAGKTSSAVPTATGASVRPEPPPVPERARSGSQRKTG